MIDLDHACFVLCLCTYHCLRQFVTVRNNGTLTAKWPGCDAKHAEMMVAWEDSFTIMCYSNVSCPAKLLSGVAMIV